MIFWQRWRDVHAALELENLRLMSQKHDIDSIRMLYLIVSAALAPSNSGLTDLLGMDEPIDGSSLVSSNILPTGNVVYKLKVKLHRACALYQIANLSHR